MLDDIVRDQIQSEIQQIEDLFVEFSELLDNSATIDPNTIERTALGSVLHSFYTGLEGIFLTVAKRVDGKVPSGERWHRDLLDQITAPTDLRNLLISAETKESLREYLAFRHFFRQAYVYVLHWEEMRGLVNGLKPTWTRVKTEIEMRKNMTQLTRRLEVLFPDDLADHLGQIAAREGCSVSTLIRNAVSEKYAVPSQAEKLEAVERLYALQASAGEWGEMESEIIEGAIE
jgi:hypothetical protein